MPLVNLLRITPFLMALFLWGCVALIPTTVPLNSIKREPGTENSDTLIIMLPGYGDRADTFKDQGFFDLSPKTIDLISVDAHFGYYEEKSIVERLHEDVVLPAKREGYKSIWMLGVSMGAVGAISYLDQHPANVDGLILIAPFLGEREIIEEVIQKGGLRVWEKTTDNYEQRIWQWLKEATIKCDVPIFLGFGQSDKLILANQLLSAHLSADSVISIPGDHSWKTWRPIYLEMVEKFNFRYPESIRTCRN